MELWARDKDLSERDQVALNHARKHQQVVFVSDIATAKGDKVNATYLAD